MDRGAWQVTVHGVIRVRHNLATKPPLPPQSYIHIKYMENNLLYIGLNGFAGSGKDTVAKMIKTILNRDWNSLEECKAYYR